MLGFYNYTVVATYASLLISCAGLFLAWRGDSLAALVCLMLSGLLDGFDGKIARTKKDRSPAERRFGIQIDSLCDLVCFGVLPAAICRSFGMTSWWQLTVFCLYILCAQIRLAYFNVQEEERQDARGGRRTYYAGLPVTSVSFLLPPVYLLHLVSPAALAWAAFALLLVMAVLFISPIRIPKLYKAGAGAVFALGAAEFLFLLILK